MVCYVQLASVRRSLFDANERAKYLQELLNGAKRILESPQVNERYVVISLNEHHKYARFDFPYLGLVGEIMHLLEEVQYVWHSALLDIGIQAMEWYSSVPTPRTPKLS